MLWAADVCSRAAIAQPGPVSSISVGRFLPVQRYASAGLCDNDVSGRLSVRTSVCLSHAGIVPSRAKAGS